MNNNHRGIRTNSDNPTTVNSGIGTRHSSISTLPNNNIHININLNVKKKSNCVHGSMLPGKKINNFIEISDSKNQIKNNGSAMCQQQQKSIKQPHNKTNKSKSTLVNSNKQQNTIKKQQTFKKKKNKDKDKIASKPFTPQKQKNKQSQQKSIQKTKTGKKLNKKKQSKSVQNLKYFKQRNLYMQGTKKSNPFNTITNELKNKDKSNSTSKQRSRSKSGKKLIKNRSSSKNIISFQNSGIKKIFQTQKQKQKKTLQRQMNKSQQNMRKSKKSLKGTKLNEQDINKLHQFMQEKRKRQKSQTRKRQKQNEMKIIKIKEQLLKVQKQRRQNANKPYHRLTPQILGLRSKQDQIKLPMFFGDDDQFDESHDYQNLKKQVNKIISQSNSIQKSYNKTPQKKSSHSEISTSGKKNKKNSSKAIKQTLFDKWYKQKITKVQMKQFIAKVTKIQACWRGYKLRKTLLQQISKINKISTIKRNQIFDKKSYFWNDDQNNSIINLDELDNQDQKSNKKQNTKNTKIQINNRKDTLNDKRVSQEVNKKKFQSPEHSNQNSSSSPNQQNYTNHKKYQSQSGPENDLNNKKITHFEIQNKYNEKNRSKEQNRNQQSNKSQKNQSRDEYLSLQIQLLKKQMEQQTKKFTQLEKENLQLKQNLKSLASEKQKQHEPEPRSIQKVINKNNPVNYEDDEVEFFEIKQNEFIKKNQNKIQKIQEIQEIVQKPKIHPHQRFKKLTIQTSLEEDPKIKNQQNLKQPIKSPSYLQSLRKQNQNYESPSNRSMQNLSSNNLISLQKVFKKKQLSIDMAYQKNTKMYHQMLQNNIVSPRTYNFKKIQLDQKYKIQKQEIKHKFKQAEKVIKFINEEIVQQQNAGEDQSPMGSPDKNQVDKGIKGEGPKQIKVEQRIQGLRKQDYKHISQKIQVEIQQDIPKNKQKQLISKQSLNRQIQFYQNQYLESSNENEAQSSNFKKYWTDDMEQVHRKVLQISSKIDQALQSDSYQSQSNKQYSSLNSNRQQYSSQNSNIQAIKSYYEKDDSQSQEYYNGRSKQSGDVSPILPIYEAKQYKIQNKSRKLLDLHNDYKNSKQNKLDDKSQQMDVLSNNSNMSASSQKSSNLSEIYDIKYPGSNHVSPSHKQPQPKNLFQLKNQAAENIQNPIENNYSGLSQNRSSVSQKSVASSNSKYKDNRGFDTRLTFIKQYCIALCQFIRSEQSLKNYFIQNISTPLKYDYFQYLRSYRTTLQNQNDTKYNSTQQDYLYPYFKILHKPIISPALTQQIYHKFQELYDQTYNVNNDLKTQVIQIRKFFIQAIIDVFNESLNFQRPGSIYGQPLPWLVQSKNLKNNPVKQLKQANQNLYRIHQSDDQNQNQEDERLDKIFGVAIAKIIQWGSCLCGFIPQPVSFDSEEAQAVNIDEQQTNLVRQTRLAYMLQKSLAQDEQKMIDNTLQQLQVDLEIQQMIFYEMISQFADQMNQFVQKRTTLG